jgi:AraC-like DNA-binding protein
LEKRANPSGRPQVTLLKAEALDQICTRQHIAPCRDLARFVAVGWTMEWRLPANETFTQQVLPNPAVQIVVSSGQAEVFGIVTGAFSTTLCGDGFVFALKFRPCGFYAVVKEPVAQFTDRRFPVRRVLPDIDGTLLEELSKGRDSRGLMDLFEGELLKLALKLEGPGDRLESLIGHMEADSSMLTVDQAADWFGVSRRTLQRLFHLYVGVSPKWMLRRFRLKEVAARIESGQTQNWADLAQQLGYYDQAHLIRDFRAIVGHSPTSYLKSSLQKARAGSSSLSR